MIHNQTSFNKSFFAERWKGEQLCYLLMIIFLLPGCSKLRKGHVQYTVKKLSVCECGRIVIEVSSHTWGPYKTEAWLQTENGKNIQQLGAGEASGTDITTGNGEESFTLKTTDPSTVRFLVEIGERFVLKPGMKKALVEYVPIATDSNEDKESEQLVLVVLPP